MSKKPLPEGQPKPEPFQDGARRWRNRIVDHAEVDPHSLKANPKNWRTHPRAQQEALDGVLKKIGWVQDVIVNIQTGLVVDGHARIDMAIAHNELVPVKYVDLSPEEEALVLASLDPLTGMAVADELSLAPLLAEIESENTALDAVLKSMLDAANQTRLEDVGEEDPLLGHGRAERFARAQPVKAVFMVEDLRIVERAIREVHEPNRGRALVLICEAYLEAHAEAAPEG